MNLNLKSAVTALENLFMNGWNGASALFGILTVVLAVAFTWCVIRITVLSIKIAVSYIQDIKANMELKELSKGKDVE